MARELAAGATCCWDPEGPARPGPVRPVVCLALGAGDDAGVSAAFLKAEALHDEPTQLRLPALMRNFPERKPAFSLFLLRPFDQTVFRLAHPPPYKRSIPF
jgi:hypothetical protein